MSADIIQDFADFVLAIDAVVKTDDVHVVLDVGSRDALVALLFKIRYPRAAVFAFECNPDALLLCRKNIGKRPVTLVEKAVTDFTGETDFFAIDPQRTRTPHADGNIGASSLYVANPEYPHETYAQNKIRVQATRIDEWANSTHSGAPDIVWMDVQGAALSALQGLGDLLRNVKAIYVELEYKTMYIGQPLAITPVVRDFLAAAGFTRYRKFYADDWFGNELFIRNDLLPRP